MRYGFFTLLELPHCLHTASSTPSCGLLRTLRAVFLVHFCFTLFNGFQRLNCLFNCQFGGPVCCHRRIWLRNPLSNLVVASILPPDCTSRVSDHSFLSRSRLGSSSCCLRRQCAHCGITNRGCHAGVLGKGRDMQLRSSSVPLGLKIFPGTTSSQAH